MKSALILLLTTCLLWSADVPDFSKLLAIAKKHHMPFPPPDARLVLVHAEQWTVLGNASNDLDPAYYVPGFLLKELPDGSIEAFVGVRKKVISPKNEPIWRPFTTQVQKRKPGGFLSEFDTSAVITAIQCAERGNTKQAEALWLAYARPKYWDDEKTIRRKKQASQTAEECLVGYLLSSYLQSLNQAHADWSQIHANCKSLIKDFPYLKKYPWEMNHFNMLTLSINAKPAAKGSVEDLLVTYSRQPRIRRDADWQCEAEKKIILMGLKAIPELAKLFNDKRLTTHQSLGGFRTPPQTLSLGALAQQLAKKIQGSGTYHPGVDEKKFFASAVFERTKNGGISRIHRTPLQIVALKYPELLPGLCEEYSLHAIPQISPYSLANAVRLSALPLEQRIAILSKYGTHGSLSSRQAYLQNLAKLDGKSCKPLIFPLIKQLPKDVDTPYWTCTEAALTHIIMQIEDDAVWKAYLTKTKSCAIGLRMEIINPMNYLYIKNKNRARRLAFLAAFLDDSEVRTVNEKSTKWDGPHAGFHFDVLSMQNYAATSIAGILPIPEQPADYWNAQQWSAFRAKVRKALAKEKLPKF